MRIEGIYYRDAILVPAFVSLPRLEVGAVINFLVDTGASRTALHSRSLEALSVSESDLDKDSITQSMGIGGHQDYYTELADLFFVGNVSWRCGIGIGPGTPSRIPPLLGMDFLNLCRLQADPRAERFVLKPYRVENGEVLAYGEKKSLLDRILLR